LLTLLLPAAANYVSHLLIVPLHYYISRLIVWGPSELLYSLFLESSPGPTKHDNKQQ